MKSLPVKWKVHLATSAVLTFFLTYIDEGYYSFQWMYDLGNWIAVAIYVAIIWVFQILLAAVFHRLLKDPLRTWLSTFAGSILGLMFMFLVVFNHV